MRVLPILVYVRQSRKKWTELSVSKAYDHKEFEVSGKSCRNLCSFRWLKSALNLLRSLFRKPTYESILLISGSIFFYSFSLFVKKEFLKISVLHSTASLVLITQNFASTLEKNVIPKFTNRLSWTLHKLC